MKNESAQSLGKLSWEKRIAGKTPEEISEMMRKTQKPKRKPKNKA